MSVSAASKSDLEFTRVFEGGEIPAGEFNRLAHLRLAYVYLCRGDLKYAEQKMREALLKFLDANEIPREKFHETLTRAWIMAVSHFMSRRDASAFSEFIAHSQALLDTKVMLTHYSAAALFSERAHGVCRARSRSNSPLSSAVLPNPSAGISHKRATPHVERWAS